MYSDTATLQTIQPDGVVPETRFKDARAVQDFSRRLITNDQGRAMKRARVNGICDGNPPYKASVLREAGRADAANYNDGTARAFMESGVGAFYDLSSESPEYVTIKTDYGNDEQRETYSRIISEEADRILREDKVWDYNVQLSQWDMVLHGCGPLMFEDAYCVLPKAFRCGDLKVPEFTKSDVFYWETYMVQAVYYPPELFKFIEDPKAAAAVGWDVDYTRKVIANAMDIKLQRGQLYNWEFYQQELKNNSLMYIDDNKVCRICHVFWKEFDGKITHTMVEEEAKTAKTTTPTSTEPGGVAYLYKKVGRYAAFSECVHPMYYDHGNGGYHHSVTGLGVKMYSLLAYNNRLLCNLSDKAFAPKILFKPTTTESAQKFQLAVFGDYAVLPPNFEWQQAGVAGLMNDGLAMHKQIENIADQNLSSYRQQPMKQEGNPVTAKQVMYDASQQAALTKTQYSRYYKQLDMLYTEIYRRMSNLNTQDDRAKEFQKRCKDRDVPPEAIARVKSVQATRVVGQGSAFMRKQSLNTLWVSVGPSLREDGRDNLISDIIAAEAGQSQVNRYYARRPSNALANDQQSEAMQWVGLMKVGVSPVVSTSQNPVVFATVYLQAGDQAAASLQQGANPTEVLSFLNIVGPAIAAQMKRYANDPSRQALLKVQEKQWNKLASLTDQLTEKLQQQSQQNGNNGQAQQQAMSEQQLAVAKTQSDIQLKTVKTQAQLKQSQEKHDQKLLQARQDMALKDAMTASDIELARKKAAADASNSSEE